MQAAVPAVGSLTHLRGLCHAREGSREYPPGKWAQGGPNTELAWQWWQLWQRWDGEETVPRISLRKKSGMLGCQQLLSPKMDNKMENNVFPLTTRCPLGFPSAFSPPLTCTTEAAPIAQPLATILWGNSETPQCFSSWVWHVPGSCSASCPSLLPCSYPSLSQ